MFGLFGLDPAEGVPDIDDIVALIHPEDRDTLVAEALSQLLADRRLHRELRGHGRLAGRTFDVAVRAELNEAGQLLRLRGACRDITTEHRRTESRRRDRVVEAAARSERDALKATIDDLRNPLPPQHTGDFDITGHTAGGADTTVRCWYETVDLPDGRLALVVGEVSGAEPTAPMLRLRLSTTGFITSGLDPAETVTAANTAFIATVPGRAATLTVARLDPATGRVDWASAGPAGPVHAGGEPIADIVAGSLGPPIGAATVMRFPLNETELRPGDRLLLYTEGLVATSGAVSTTSFDALRFAVTADSAETALTRLTEDADAAATSGSVLLAQRRK